MKLPSVPGSAPSLVAVIERVAVSSSSIETVAAPELVTDPAGADTGVTAPNTTVNCSPFASRTKSSVIGMLMSTVSVALPPTKVATPVTTFDGSKSPPASAVPGTNV